MARSRKFTFTINNYTQDHIDLLSALGDKTEFLVYGKEVGDSGTPHLQGFVYYKNPQRVGTVRQAIPGHIEVANGTVEQNVVYCSKDGDTTTFGTQPLSQKRKGAASKELWNEVISLAEAGDEARLKLDHPGIYFRCLKTIRSHRAYGIDDLPSGSKHLWYFGATGTGKSHRAREHTPFYLKNINKWWDGYRDEPFVIVEEWSPEADRTIQAMKKWADKYSFNAEIKGGQITIRPKVIIVTSNFSMRECFPRDQDYFPLKRRFTEIYCINQSETEIHE